MAEKKEVALAQGRAPRDPFALLREMTSELERAFERPFGTAFRWPSPRRVAFQDASDWAPEIDVFERDNRLVTKVDLPGLKKEDVRVEVTDGHHDFRRAEERNRRKERQCLSARTLLRQLLSRRAAAGGAKLEDVKATFANGVLEVSVPLPAKVQEKPRTVQIEEAAKPAKGAAA